MKRLSIVFFFVGLILCSCRSKSNKDQFTQQNPIVIENSSKDSINPVNGIFAVPELKITPSPVSENHYTFSNSEKVIDYDISPIGMSVAVLVEEPEGKYSIKFWQINQSQISENYELPDGITAKAITWHPMAKALFVIGTMDSNNQIYRIEKNNDGWACNEIFSSPNQLRRLVVSPRPFIVGDDPKSKIDIYKYRIFFGMDNGDNTYRIVSITENGERFYQVIGPSKSFTKASDLNAYVDPSNMEAEWALPIAFHPAGHQLIWQDKGNKFYVARYYSSGWGESKPMNLSINNYGTITPTPNGIGLIHWQKDKQGIGIYLLASKEENIQLPSYKFISTPSTVPDGKGVVGLTSEKGCYTLNYLPINIPLADVVNAWMFTDTKEETDLFHKNFGLFRPTNNDQLFKLYESENYYCNSYDRSSPTRPYLVTTDIFWESFGAAYQGLFIVKERDQAIPNFWKFVEEGNNYLKKTDQNSPWVSVFTALTDLQTGNLNNTEVKRILAEEDCYTELIDSIYSYSNLKPRGHYNSSPEMENYFRAFRYFSTIYNTKQSKLKQINQLPSEIITLAEKWIDGYSGLIAPSRWPLVWNNVKQVAPSYCVYPQKDLTIFPLSWGFDNEILFSTVFHENFPAELQVKGTGGLRLLPNGLDLASALGNGFAEKLLESDYEKYPPLRKVINNLKGNFKESTSKPDMKDNLYNQWINAIAVQWADTVNSTNGTDDRGLWQTKRLQTGLATWATLRHATILVNERGAAECGEAGFEEILMRAPRGYVEPDPNAFAALADLFEGAIKYISNTAREKDDINSGNKEEKQSLYDGIVKRLKESAQETRIFQAMAEKERRGELLTNEENEKILYVARTAEHLFLLFNSIKNTDYGISDPDPIGKIADVFGDGYNTPYLMAAVGNGMEWDFVVPFYGRHQIVKGSIYSYYEFESKQLLNDKEWREKISKQEFVPWIKPYITEQGASGMAETLY